MVSTSSWRGVLEPEARGRGPSILAAVLAVAVSVAVSLVLLWPQHGRALNWDEVDYLNAARQGVITNLWDSNALPVADFIRFTRDKLADRDATLPAGYDEATDVFRLRHGHSPGVVVAMVPTADAAGERAARAVQLVGAAALTAALVVAYRLVSTTWTWGGLAVLLVVGPWYGWHMFRSLQFHGWTTVWFCLAFAFLCRWLTEGRPRSWGLALCAALALLILTLESSAFVLVGVVACLVIWVRGLRRRAREPWIRRYLVPGLLVVVGITVLVWPGLVVKGGFLKLPAERVAQVFIGGGDVYYFNSQADVLSYLLPAALGAIVVGYLWRRRRDEVLRWGPLLVVAGIYLASVIRFAVNNTYFLPALAPILVLFAWIVGDLRRRTQAAVAAGMAVVMAGGLASLAGTNQRDQERDEITRADFAFVGAFVAQDRGLFDGGHIYRHYLPGTRIEDISYDSDELLIRRGGDYDPFPPQEYQGTVIGVQANRKLFLDGPGARDLSANCPRIDRPTVVLWDCRGFRA